MASLSGTMASGQTAEVYGIYKGLTVAIVKVSKRELVLSHQDLVDLFNVRNRNRLLCITITTAEHNLMEKAVIWKRMSFDGLLDSNKTIL